MLQEFKAHLNKAQLPIRSPTQDATFKPISTYKAQEKTTHNRKQRKYIWSEPTVVRTLVRTQNES